jgi:hypothetical protein
VKAANSGEGGGPGNAASRRHQVEVADGLGEAAGREIAGARIA